MAKQLCCTSPLVEAVFKKYVEPLNLKFYPRTQSAHGEKNTGYAYSYLNIKRTAQSVIVTGNTNFGFAYKDKRSKWVTGYCDSAAAMILGSRSQAEEVPASLSGLGWELTQRVWLQEERIEISPLLVLVVLENRENVFRVRDVEQWDNYLYFDDKHKEKGAVAGVHRIVDTSSSYSKHKGSTSIEKMTEEELLTGPCRELRLIAEAKLSTKDVSQVLKQERLKERLRVRLETALVSATNIVAAVTFIHKLNTELNRSTPTGLDTDIASVVAKLQKIQEVNNE